MGLFRLFFFVALIVAAFWLWRRYIRPAINGQKRTPPPVDPRPMVRCAHCQVHLPLSQAIKHDDQWFCSQAHLEQGRHTP